MPESRRWRCGPRQAREQDTRYPALHLTRSASAFLRVRSSQVRTGQVSFVILEAHVGLDRPK
jgi:hypothetical protein